VKPAPFDYVAPRSLEEALEELALRAARGDDAKVLAGGQSLIPVLNFRLAQPAVLVDINAIGALDFVTERADGSLAIGALARQRQLERSALVTRRAPLLAEALPFVAHPQIRSRGTLGGSLAHADPAAEWPACCVALDADIVIASRAGERRVKARDFYKGLFETALGEGELVAAVELPLLGAGYRSVFLELARRHGDYAMVGVAAAARPAGGTLADLRLAFLGAGTTPILARNAMAAAEGKKASPDTIAAAQGVLEKDLAPIGDLNASPATKLHLARVLCGRALAQLAA
jgi:carbon-monoxide dehydrogenase medium subunit